MVQRSLPRARATCAAPAFIHHCASPYPPRPALVGYCARSAAHSDGRAVAASRSASSCLMSTCSRKSDDSAATAARSCSVIGPALGGTCTPRDRHARLWSGAPAARRGAARGGAARRGAARGGAGAARRGAARGGAARRGAARRGAAARGGAARRRAGGAAARLGSLKREAARLLCTQCAEGLVHGQHAVDALPWARACHVLAQVSAARLERVEARGREPVEYAAEHLECHGSRYVRYCRGWYAYPVRTVREALGASQRGRLVSVACTYPTEAPGRTRQLSRSRARPAPRSSARRG